MTEIKVEDVLIPLLKSHSDEINFDKIKVTRNNPKPLYLIDDFGFSINFIHVKNSKELKDLVRIINKSKKFDCIKKNQQDSIDDLFLRSGTDLFNRKIYRSKKEIKMEMKFCDYGIKQFSCRLFINIANIQYKKDNKIPYHIISLILTSFNYNENSNLCNKQIINLVNGELNAYNRFSSLNGLPKKVENLLKKDTFVAIQLWNHRWKSEKDNTFDAKTYVKENPYYFYSILTLEENVFRRTYENIMDVLGWCQSASSAYFDVFYGTTCLELTIKPKRKIFNETGHDSEEFRIWELLALQKKLLDEINEKEMNNVDDLIKELDLIYNFKIYTKKIGKGEKWIRYGEYLQKITGIDSAYHDYKLKNEMKNKERESKLQKLNSLIIVSIFISFLTLFSSPIYSSWVSTYNNDDNDNLSLNSTNYSFFENSFFENIFKNPNPEITVFVVAIFLTCVSYLYAFGFKNTIHSIYIKILAFISVVLSIIHDYRLNK